MGRSIAVQFRMPDPEEMFPPVSVDPRDLLRFSRNPVTRELLRRIQKEVFATGTRAFEKDEVTYEERKGRGRGLKWVLEQLEDIASGTESDTEASDENELEMT